MKKKYELVIPDDSAAGEAIPYAEARDEVLELFRGNDVSVPSDVALASLELGLSRRFFSGEIKDTDLYQAVLARFSDDGQIVGPAVVAARNLRSGEITGWFAVADHIADLVYYDDLAYLFSFALSQAAFFKVEAIRVERSPFRPRRVAARLLVDDGESGSFILNVTGQRPAYESRPGDLMKVAFRRLVSNVVYPGFPNMVARVCGKFLKESPVNGAPYRLLA